jgi:hypothetical protein
MRTRHIACIGLVCILTATPMRAADAPTPEPQLRSWLLDTCPVTPVDRPRAFAETLIGLGINFAFDKVGAAISEAAKEDREGKATAGTSGAYLYWHTPAITADPSKAASQVAMSCLVVALADSRPAKWCSSEPFRETSLCAKNGDKWVSKLHDVGGRKPLQEGATGSSPPRFYAEIALGASPDRVAVAPELRTLYYPKGIHEDSPKFKGNKKPRDLLITSSAVTPQGETALGTVAIHIKGFKPVDRLLTAADPKSGPEAADLEQNPTGSEEGHIPAAGSDPLWVALVRLPKDAPLPDKETYAFPVNLKSEVREVGKPSALLQAFATIFDDQKADLRSSAREALVPSVREAAELTAAAATADALSKYSTAVSAAYKAQADYRTACNDATKPVDVKKALARQHFLATVAAQTSAESLAKKVTEPKDLVIFNPRFAENLDDARSDDVAKICGLAQP